METQSQYFTITQRHNLLILLHRFEFFYGTLGTWKTDPVDFESKEDANPICLIPYSVPKVHEEIFKKEFERLLLLLVL